MRYLYDYVCDGNHNVMVTTQMQQFVRSCTLNEVCECVQRIALSSKVSHLDPALLHGVAYISDQSTNTGYLLSPRCIYMVLNHQNIVPGNDWRKLELLTWFMLQNIECSVTNFVGDTIDLPMPVHKHDQGNVRELPDLGASPEYLISLASGHPVIDAILVSCHHRCVYFIQTSFMS